MGRGQVMVVLTAWSPGAEGDEGKAGSEALARYGSKLALERVASDGDSPILVGRRLQAVAAAQLREHVRASGRQALSERLASVKRYTVAV
jgi:hypothetical protein